MTCAKRAEPVIITELFKRGGDDRDRASSVNRACVMPMQAGWGGC